MNIASTHTSSRTNHRNTRTSCRPSQAPSTPAAKDQITIGTSRHPNPKLITAGAVIAGASLGSLLGGSAVDAMTVSATEILAKTSGALAGVALLGVGGIILLEPFSSPTSPGSGFLPLAAIGGVLGAGAGNLGLSLLLENGAGNVLGYALGAITGGAVGALMARNINN